MSQLQQPSSTATNNIDNTCIVKLFSIGGQERKSDVVHYVMFDWACKVTTIAFNISFPLLISVLGDAKFGDGQGKIVFSYLTTLSSILVSLSYLTFTSVFEYSLMKRKGLSRFAFISSFFLMLFIFCFVGDAIYLACFLVVVSKVSQSISQIAYDSLLDAISKGRDPHSVSTRGYIAGYSGMLAFLVYAAPILGVLLSVQSTVSVVRRYCAISTCRKLVYVLLNPSRAQSSQEFRTRNRISISQKQRQK